MARNVSQMQGVQTRQPVRQPSVSVFARRSSPPTSPPPSPPADDSDDEPGTTSTSTIHYTEI
jgi:hypothetical protein